MLDISAHTRVRVRGGVFFWLSLLCHLLLFSTIYAVNVFHPIPAPAPMLEKSEYYYVPAYTYSQPSVPRSSRTVQNVMPAQAGIQSSRTAETLSSRGLTAGPSASHIIASDPLSSAIAQLRSQKSHERRDPIHMIGEKLSEDPLRKLLGRAITAHLYYPGVARELNMRGIVSVSFVLHPSGEITDAYIVKTSHKKMLDVAAYHAIVDASPIANVDIYLKEDKRLVVNVIF